MKYYFSAGERSGDLHGSNLVKELKSQDPEAVVRGMGGELMKKAGCDVFMDYSKISFMGFAEVVTNLGKIRKAFRLIEKDLVDFKPDVLILIDFAGFNLRLAKFARDHGIKVYYYISPKIWAWKQSRAYKIKERVDEMFVIMPFEKEFYQRFDYHNVNYIGNPLLDAVSAFKPLPDTFPPGNYLAVLPGSRKQEISAMMRRLPGIAEKFKNYKILVAGLKSVDNSLYAVATRMTNVELIFDKTYEILSVAEGAIVTSGTATLETALFKVPQVVVYEASFLTYHIAKALIKVPYISLVNLIAGKELVRELIQKEFNPESIASELSPVLKNGTQRQQVLDGYEVLREKLGTPGASRNAAELIVSKLKA